MSARYLGDFTPGKTIRGRFNTVRPSSGVPFTLAGTPTLAVYKDASTTESTAGVTLTVDFDARTGMHFYAIDTSADGTFYSSGSDFTVALTAGTVDSVSAVGLVVGAFSLANRSALRPTTADRTLDVSAGGEAGLDWANVGSPTTTLNLSGTTISTSQTIQTVTTATNLTNLPSIPANWLTAAGIAASALNGKGDWNVGKTGYSLTPTTGLGNQTANITGTITTVTTATNLTNLPSIPANWLTAAGIAADAITAAKVAADVGTEIGTAVWATTTRRLSDGTNIVLAKGTGITGFNDLDAAGVRSAVGLASANLDTQIDALPTASENADAVWDEVLSGHLTAGSTGNALNAAGSAGDPWSTVLPGSYGVGTAGNIIGNRLDVAVGSRLASASYTAPLDAAGTRTALGMSSPTLDTQLSAIDTVVDSIKATTDKLDTALELDGAVYRFTTNALELAPSGSGGDPWASTMETGVTYAGAMRAIYGVAAGDSSGFTDTSSTAVYKSSDGTKTRVTATVDTYGNRTVTARDLT
jgi:hypothetical protein